jgi:hypothetical protein
MMEIGTHSKRLALKTFVHWHVDRDYVMPLFNYVWMGLAPGGFFTSVLANDWGGAIQRSHPGNTIPALKNATGWILDRVPAVARGSYPAVEAWCYHLSDEERTQILLDHGLVLPPQRELLMVIKNTPDSRDPLEHYPYID